MNINEERALRGQKPIPTAAQIAEKWRRNALAAADTYAEAIAGIKRHAADVAAAARAECLETLSELQHRARELRDSPHAEQLTRLAATQAEEIARIARNLDHLHDDVVALRELANSPRPECYPDAPRRRRARRAPDDAARRDPPPTSPPEASGAIEP